MVGQSVLSANLQTTPEYEKHTEGRTVTKRDLDRWRNGLAGTSGSSLKANAKVCTWRAVNPITNTCW